MHRRIAAAAGILATALTMSLSMTGTAHAEQYPGDAACNTTGAHGRMHYSNYHGPDATVNITFTLDDTLSDGYGVRLRLVSTDVWGKTHYWPWRTNSKGYGTSSTWSTTASHPNGLFNIGVQVARFNSSGTNINTCTGW
ncbi:hypothetical protein [Streptomyces sp. NPDC088757]|uniref:hypothetical protein n=1 Tax=Streptomyces sp. NPDC088757 TaxID=3365889 RepID=UPI00380DACDA